jgi:chromate transport protein ChrA
VGFMQFILRVVAFNAEALGNGSVMIPLVRKSFVGGGIMTEQQLLFAFTIAQVVPGQANLYVASMGYMLFGFAAALIAILAINLPGYLMLPLIGCYRRLDEYPAARNFNRGLTSASVGLIFASTLDIARNSLNHPVSWGVLAATLALIQFRRWSPLTSLVVASGAGMLLLTFC